MKIFKNRGDIFISRKDKKDDLERKILLIILCIIVVFTLIFLIVVGAKNNYSAKKFFLPDTSQQVTVQQGETTTQSLPKVSGKNNFLFLITNRDGTSMYMMCLIQLDMDSISYKVCNILPETIIDGTSVNKIFYDGGIKNTMSAIEAGYGITLNYYTVMSSNELSDFYDDMGEVTYPIINDIKFKSSDENNNYSLNVKAGEKSLNGKEITSLLQYYINEKKDVSTANDIILYSLSQLINEKNLEQKDEIFKNFVTYADTNITVRNFSQSGDIFTVLSNENVGVNAYNVEAKYKNSEITSSGLSTIKSYFAED